MPDGPDRMRALPERRIRVAPEQTLFSLVNSGSPTRRFNRPRKGCRKHLCRVT